MVACRINFKKEILTLMVLSRRPSTKLILAFEANNAIFPKLQFSFPCLLIVHTCKNQVYISKNLWRHEFFSNLFLQQHQTKHILFVMSCSLIKKHERLKIRHKSQLLVLPGTQAPFRFFLVLMLLLV